MKNYRSPNFNERSEGRIKYLILHYTGMASGLEALERLCDPDAQVGAHYLVEEDGEIFSLIDESKRAWHAGVSKWELDDDINDLSVGIEIVNTGHSCPGYDSIYRPFPDEQMRAVTQLSQQIIQRHNIKPCHVLGHSDVAWRRKMDPGELFDWENLSKQGIGCWPDAIEDYPQIKISTNEFISKLQAYGYDTEGCNENPAEIITAFQRHFRQRNIDGGLDSETFLILENLLGKKLN